MQSKIILTLLSFVIWSALFANDCFFSSAERMELRANKFSSIALDANPKTYEPKTMLPSYKNADPYKGVKYLDAEERKAFELILKPDGSPNAKLFHTPEAQERLLGLAKIDLIKNPYLLQKSPALKAIQEGYDAKILELSKKYGDEFDKKNAEAVYAIKKDPSPSVEDHMFLHDLEFERKLHIYKSQRVEMDKVKAEMSQKIDGLLKDPHIARELEYIKKELGGPVTTKSESAIYVMTPEGKIYLNELPVVDFFHHSSFLAGNPVAAAGEMKIVNGVPKRINLESGHYHPENSSLDQMAVRLRRAGVDITETDLKYRKESGSSFQVKSLEAHFR